MMCSVIGNELRLKAIQSRSIGLSKCIDEYQCQCLLAQITVDRHIITGPPPPPPSWAQGRTCSVGYTLI